MASGAERYVLILGSLVPVAVVALVVQVSGSQPAAPDPVRGDAAEPPLVTNRPRAFEVQPPPTLIPPTPVPQATATPVPATPTVHPSPTAATGRTYTVRPGDQLKHIAAEYGVSIWKIIEGNDIPDPDSLRIGQVLKIPDN